MTGRDSTIQPRPYLYPHGQSGGCDPDPAGNRAVFSVNTTHASLRGTTLLQDVSELTGSDVFGSIFTRSSEDNGRTWTPLRPLFRPEPQEDGAVLRRGESTWFLSPATGRLYRFYNTHRYAGAHFTAAVWETTRIVAECSTDGGKTFGAPSHLLAESGDGNPPVISFCRPVATEGGLILPVQRIIAQGDNESGQPVWEAGCLFGKECGDAIAWTPGGASRLETHRSGRGIFEPAIARLRDGRLLMIARGSNRHDLSMPGRKWVSLSGDGGKAWSAPKPLAWEDGEPLFSPSSGSSLVRHSRGALYWIGNVTPRNPEGNRPRYPLVLAAVDEERGALKRSTLRVLDDRSPRDGEHLQLSNFRLFEDRETAEIVLHMARLEQRGNGDLHSPSYEYRIPV